MFKGRSIHFTLLPLIIILVLSSSISDAYAWEIDLTSDVNRIIDGDTFEISEWNETLDRYERVRLADVSAPEPEDPGGSESTQILSNIIGEKVVFLDKDPVRSYDRLVAVVYIKHNSTHYKNVNEALLEYDVFSLDNYDNEFNPSTWKLFVRYADPPSQEYFLTLLKFGQGRLTPSEGTRTYGEGTEVTVTAEPDSGYEFSNWTLNGDYYGNSYSTKVTMNTDLTLAAYFTEIQSQEPDPSPSPEPTPSPKPDPKEPESKNYSLNIVIEGSGTTSPENRSYTYIEDTEIEIHAYASVGWEFNQCRINNQTTDNILPINITMDQNQDVTIVFTRSLPSSNLTYFINDEEGKPIPQVQITSTSQPRIQDAITVETGENGIGTTGYIYHGEYSISFNKQGYDSATRNDSIQYNQSKIIKMTLNYTLVDIEFTLEDNHGAPAGEIMVTSITQPFNQIQVADVTDDRGSVIFETVKPGDYSFQISGRWIRNRDVSYYIPLAGEKSHDFRELVQRTSALILHFEDEAAEYESVDNVRIETLICPEGQEDINITINSGCELCDLLPGNYTFKFSKEDYEITQSYVTIEGESHPEFVVLKLTPDNTDLGVEILLVMMLFSIPFILFYINKIKKTRQIQNEIPEIPVQLDPENPVIPEEEVEMEIQNPEPPRFWGTPKGYLIEAIVIDGLHDLDEIKTHLKMDENEFQKNFYAMLITGELEGRRDGFFVQQDLQDEWIRHYQ